MLSSLCRRRGASCTPDASCCSLLPHPLPSLHSCASYRLLGSLAEAESGAAPELPLSERSALLALLLGLAGTRPSLRQRRFTFQADAARHAPRAALSGLEGPLSSAVGSSSARYAAAPAPPQHGAAQLTEAVFCEAPDPHALTQGGAAVAALLPEELGLPSDAFAGIEDVQASPSLQRACVASRAAWFFFPDSLGCQLASVLSWGGVCRTALHALRQLLAAAAQELGSRWECAGHFWLMICIFDAAPRRISLLALAAALFGAPPPRLRCRRSAPPPGSRCPALCRRCSGTGGGGRRRARWASR